MMSKPTKEHEWLNRFLGEWTYEFECEMGPGEPKATFTGRERVRSLGGLWVVGEGEGECPGSDEPGTTILTVGYNPNTKRFVGSWVGSMMDHMWVYDGELDPSGRVLSLNTEGPDFGTEGKTAKYRDVHEFRSDDHRVLTSEKLGDDGEWRAMMTAHYKRQG